MAAAFIRLKSGVCFGPDTVACSKPLVPRTASHSSASVAGTQGQGYAGRAKAHTNDYGPALRVTGAFAGAAVKSAQTVDRPRDAGVEPRVPDVAPGLRHP